MNRKEEIEELKKSTKEEFEKMCSDLPGGKTAFFIGVSLAFLIATIGVANFLCGLAAVALLSIVFFFYTRGLLDISKMAEGILITSFVFLPIFIIVYLLFWVVVSLISGIILLFL